MTPQELREKRLNILEAMLLELSPSQVMLVTEADEWLGRFEELDAEYSAVQSAAAALSKDAYYSFIRSLDRAYDSLKQSEGVPSHEIAAIDVMIDTLVKRAEMLKRAGQ